MKDDLLPKWIRAVCAAAFFCGVAIAGADTVMLSPVEDATISEKDGLVRLGGETTLETGTTGPIAGTKKNRALIRFDLEAAIPGDAVVTAVSLTLTVVQTPPIPLDVRIGLHKVAAAWRESDASWVNRWAAPVVPWSFPGGAPPADYASSASQSILVTGVAAFTFATAAPMVADVQEWVTHPARNAGWIMLCDAEDVERSVRKFGSREAGNRAARPVLTVEFSRPAPAPVLTVLPLADGQFQFSFLAEANTGYTVETSPELTALTWSVLTTIAPDPAPAIRLVTDPLSMAGRHFYRVRTP